MKKRSAPKAKTSKKASSEQGAAVVVATADPKVARAITAVAKGVAVARDAHALESAVATGASAALVDVHLPGENAYELLRRLRPRARARFALLAPWAKQGERDGLLALAKTAGAEVVLGSPPRAAEVREFLAPRPAPAAERFLAKENDAARSDAFRDRVLREVARPHDPALLAAISDPETRLHSSAFGAFVLDQEYKRAARFGWPLSVALVGFEGEASTETLLDLAGIFLNEVRDTDALARFDSNTFLFVLPSTVVEGARAMLERTAAAVRERGLRDVVGDALVLAGGVAGSARGEGREQLFARARRAFEKARDESLAAVIG
ncbi:MAG TPA: hypothetical protein VKE69_00390 [Planctomycetota bacterium]|nr:hypothetical protein [Planctomycetota bacterium]